MFDIISLGSLVVRSDRQVVLLFLGGGAESREGENGFTELPGIGAQPLDDLAKGSQELVPLAGLRLLKVQLLHARFRLLRHVHMVGRAIACRSHDGLGASSCLCVSSSSRRTSSAGTPSSSSVYRCKSS